MNNQIFIIISTFLKKIQIQSNLDYSKCQGPQESFRIIGSSNDRKREFSDIFGTARTFHRTSLFCQSSQLQLVFSVIGTSVKALKKMNFLEVMVSLSLMLCRCKIAEKKENRSLLTSTTCIYMKQLKIKVKCKLTNHILTKYCLLFNRPNVIRSPFQLANSVGPSTANQR